MKQKKFHKSGPHLRVRNLRQTLARTAISLATNNYLPVSKK